MSPTHSQLSTGFGFGPHQNPTQGSSREVRAECADPYSIRVDAVGCKVVLPHHSSHLPGAAHRGAQGNGDMPRGHDGMTLPTPPRTPKRLSAADATTLQALIVPGPSPITPLFSSLAYMTLSNCSFVVSCVPSIFPQYYQNPTPRTLSRFAFEYCDKRHDSRKPGEERDYLLSQS